MMEWRHKTKLIRKKKEILKNQGSSKLSYLCILSLLECV